MAGSGDDRYCIDTVLNNKKLCGLVGGQGNDKLVGRAGHDWLFGGPGADELLGGSGDDLLRGGPGLDKITGGAGHNDIHQ